MGVEHLGSTDANTKEPLPVYSLVFQYGLPTV